MKKEKLLGVYRLMIVLVGWFGIMGSFTMKIITRAQGESAAMALLDSISHYTIQTNLLVLIWITCALMYWIKKGKVKTDNSVLKTGITMYITFTFVIYALMLQGLWSPTGIKSVLAFITHYITPVAFIIDWLACELINGKQTKKNYKNAVKWLIYPSCYVIYVMIYGKITGKYMYPFLHVPSIGYSGVFMRVFILSILFFLMGMFYIKCNSIIQGRKSRILKSKNNEISR
ncbi:Pr6Pr family membrane protein [Oceanirhabdus seepicola]|uniref:Pr6Pr family membrane protein n=1 Tax=Oceanirhabdus seepicola TaxID=2828781 RepID=A0A9J6P516_9CLOT|nr:Pr6Pr family membrane protein [Oceanirhabdus seepicola]MCM1990728.1 Pr6Pr family membrane protein [Oceanirhabdus seepicola]